ncbi:hypothetical protein GCM10011328_07540 [Hafnia psychrotolerans]|uniref:Uncharacterized protein n=1 Tax=Hafnia psychrotolerans TaxID=1477018 RepID=A0ABQ1G2D0_9GAMM|nr:hypothetical protein GCM10011328_07540 [Hafnia psychrotolerans]
MTAQNSTERFRGKANDMFKVPINFKIEMSDEFIDWAYDVSKTNPERQRFSRRKPRQ